MNLNLPLSKKWLLLLLIMSSFSGWTQIIVQDDFSNAANWNRPNSANSLTWEVGNVTPANMSANMGGDMASTSNGNGFAYFNGVDEWVNTHANQHDPFIEYVPQINCGSNANILLEFEQRAKVWQQDSMVVEVSNDNWASFDSYRVNASFAAGTTIEQNLLSVNISATAGSETDVKIRFRWYSPGNGADTGYGWMIDDFVVKVAPQNNLSHIKSYVSGATDSWSEYVYTMVPLVQVQPLYVRTVIENTGSVIQTNVVSNSNINLGQYSLSNTGVSIAASEVDTVVSTTTFTPNNIPQVYTINNTITQSEVDGDMNNNVGVHTFETTDYIYAKDDGEYTNFYTMNPYEDRRGVLFDVTTTQQLEKVSVFIPPNNEIGDEFTVSLWEFNGSTDYVYLEDASSEISAQDLGAFKNVSFSIELEAGKSYIASVQANSDTMYIGADLDAKGMVFVDNQGEWYLSAELPMIRLDFEPCVTIQGPIIDTVVCAGGGSNSLQWSDFGVTGSQASNYLFEGQNIYTFAASNGCDSLLTVNVTYPSLQSQVPVAICSGLSYVLPDGVVVENITSPSTHYSIIPSVLYPECDSTVVTNINIMDNPIVELSVTNTTCGQNDGAVNTAIFGGALPYDVDWSNGETSFDIANLQANTYYVTVTDDNGCQTLGTAAVSNTEITTNAVVTNNVCVGESNASISVQAVSPAMPLTYSWTNGATTSDVSGLADGNYELIIQDTNNCQASLVFDITSEDEIILSGWVTSANCGSTDGGIDITATGGDGELTYAWENANDLGNILATTEDYLNIGQGNYILTVTDESGCEKVITGAVSELGAPVVSLNELTHASCVDDGAIDIDISTLGTIQSTVWSNGETAEDVSGLSAGTYSVVVTDNGGCVANYSATVISTLPEAIEICMVTVDTSTNTNLIVWEDPVDPTVEKIYIYRESSQLGDYQLIDSVLVSDLSEYNDITAFPHLRSWRYKISTVNSCGIESYKSPAHKTIHVSLTAALGGGYNINWDAYEGFGYGTFDIWRYDNVNGWSLTPIQSLSTVNFSYLDIPTETDGVDYMVTVTPDGGACLAAKANDYNSSRSNRAGGIFVPLVDTTQSIQDLMLNNGVDYSIHPNPFNSMFNLNLSSSSELTEISIFDLRGKLLIRERMSSTMTTINMSKYDKGVYMLELKRGNKIAREKLVKN